MYGKLEYGALTCAPRGVTEGYKLVTFTKEPEAPTGYYYESGWEEDNDEIVQTWTLVKLPDDVDPEEALEFLFGGES